MLQLSLSLSSLSPFKKIHSDERDKRKEKPLQDRINWVEKTFFLIPQQAFLSAAAAGGGGDGGAIKPGLQGVFGVRSASS